MAITEEKHFKIAGINTFNGLSGNPTEDIEWLETQIKDAFTDGRVSVLKDFDDMCAADGFVGFTPLEWAGVKKFFNMNKVLSAWDKPKE